MLRVKNESRWLREVLASIQPLTRDIVIFDDHSTDETPEIARAMGAAVMASPFEPGVINEARDKDVLLAAVRLHNPDFVLAIDGDEVLEAGAAAKILPCLKTATQIYGLTVVYLWGDRQHYRTDGVYGRMVRTSIFAPAAFPAAKYRQTEYGCNFHTGQVPLAAYRQGETIPCDLLHLGYMDRADRLRKYEFYTRMDPNNATEDRYRHVVQGDLPQFPAGAKFLHAGPLKVVPLPEGKWAA
jgi:glycosyltransferase involved in cell wall biosynthesis